MLFRVYEKRDVPYIDNAIQYPQDMVLVEKKEIGWES
jgi:hypothetical protein